MPSYHAYLISSLPMLHFGAKPPFGFGAFIEACRGLVPDEELSLLGSIGEGGRFETGHKQETLCKWYEFEISLRNELVRTRAVRRKTDPARYMREDGYPGLDTARAAQAAQRNPSIMEAELALDRERWHKLDELAMGHYFDTDSLVIYALKLLILERWQIVHSADGRKMLEETAGKV